MPNQWKHFLDLLCGMTEKELKARYKNTVFGFLWMIINPVLQMLIIGFVFNLFIKVPIENYYFYLFSGLLIWNFFSLSLTKVTPCIVNERTLIKKAKFPTMVVPLSIIFSNLIHLLLALIIFIPVVSVLGTFKTLNFPELIIGIVILSFFTASLGLLTSALDVRFRDINFFVQAVLIVWFYATPIVYSIYVIPANFMWLWRLNPLTSIVQIFQNALVGSPPPGLGMITANLVIIVVTAVTGYRTFKSESRTFDDWI